MFYFRNSVILLRFFQSYIFFFFFFSRLCRNDSQTPLKLPLPLIDESMAGLIQSVSGGTFSLFADTVHSPKQLTPHRSFPSLALQLRFRAFTIWTLILEGPLETGSYVKDMFTSPVGNCSGCGASCEETLDWASSTGNHAELKKSPSLLSQDCRFEWVLFLACWSLIKTDPEPTRVPCVVTTRLDWFDDSS